MTYNYLIRHGELDNPQGLFYGRSVDLELNDLGKKQIAELGRAIKQKGNPPEVLFTSPMTRTRQSAAILAEIFGNVAVILSDDLLEIASSGFEGWKVKQILGLADYLYHPPTGVTIESVTAVAQRMKRVLFSANQEYAGKNIGFVSHGDPIAILKWALSNGDIFPLSGREILDTSPAKGTAWKMRVDTEGRFTDFEMIYGS